MSLRFIKKTEAPKSRLPQGLDDVPVAESQICRIDGINGHLFYRGYSIDDLAEHSSYEEAAYLLLEGHLPSERQMKSFRAMLRSSRDLSPEVLSAISSFPSNGSAMEMLQAVVMLLKVYDHPLCGHEGPCGALTGIHQIAQLPSVIAAYSRCRRGMEYIAPRTDLPHGSNFLYMLTGVEPDSRDGEILDKCLLLHAEHGFNASTFAARVVASTDSTCYCGISAAIGALQGPLHGGANEGLFNTLSAIGEKSNVEAWLENTLRSGGKVPGMGHRVYNVKDPRAVIIEGYLEDVSKRHGDHWMLDLLRELESQAVFLMKARGKAVHSNVDFFSGALYHMIGIPRGLFTPLFAAARSAGWLAHIREQRARNRLIRPRCVYTGPERLAYVPITER